MQRNRIITLVAFKFNIVLKKSIDSRVWLEFGVFMGLKDDKIDKLKDLKLTELRKDAK